MPPIKSLLAALIWATAAFAASAAPRVVADIAPVHSLASAVMDGLGAPRLLLPPGTDPHHHALRPSEAEALAGADLVIWSGESLAPWLAGPLERLAGDAFTLRLSTAHGVMLRPMRGAEDGDAGIRAPDPHFWLDPRNAAAMALAIAEALAAVDAPNADRYRSRGQELAKRLEVLEREIAAELPPGRARYAAAHDALGYFEARFGIEPAPPLAPADGGEASPRALQAAHDRALRGEIACFFTINGEGARAARRAAEGTSARIVDLDVFGAEAAPGPDRYFAMMRALAAKIASCATP